jgi:hypothetical protein
MKPRTNSIFVKASILSTIQGTGGAAKDFLRLKVVQD